MIKELFKNNDYEITIKCNCIHIKKYINIIDIDNSKINIRLNKCNIIIYGKDLLISCMDEYECVIKGNIRSIEFINE